MNASKDTYDISKIIEYPGFNIPLPNDHNIMDVSYSWHFNLHSRNRTSMHWVKLRGLVPDFAQ
jgi:hypothetical protein